LVQGSFYQFPFGVTGVRDTARVDSVNLSVRVWRLCRTAFPTSLPLFGSMTLLVSLMLLAM